MAKEGSVIAGLMDSFATAISLALQHGVPLNILCDKFKGTRFEPSGFTGNQEIAHRHLDHGLPVPLAVAALPRATSCTRPRGRARAQLDLPHVPVIVGDDMAEGSGVHSIPVESAPQAQTGLGARDRRAALPRVRHADGAQRRLPQVPQLRLAPAAARDHALVKDHGRSPRGGRPCSSHRVFWSISRRLRIDWIGE